MALTPQEFEKLKGLLSTNTSSSEIFSGAEDDRGYFERVGSKLKGNAEDITSSVKTALTAPEIVKGDPLQTASNIMSRGVFDIPRAALRTVGGVASAITTPIFEAPGIKQTLEGIGSAISEIPGAEWLGQNLAKLAEQNPEIAKDIQNAADIFAVKGISKIPFTKKTVSAGISDISKIPSNVAKSVSNVFSPATEYAKSRFPKLLGIFSGENNDVITQAMKNPVAATLGAKQGNEALRNAIKEGSKKSIEIKTKFITDYAKAKTSTLGKYASTAVDKNKIASSFNNLLKEYGVNVKKGVLDFTKSKIIANAGEVGNIQKAFNALSKWGKMTNSTLDDYKQLVGELTKFAKEAGGSSKSPLLGRFYNELNTTLKGNLPSNVASKYSALNGNFSKYIETFDDIVDAFNSGDPFTRFANALGKNKDSLDQLLKFYEQQGGKKILPIVAGRELAMEKTAAFGFLNPRSWVDLLISPEKQAEIIIKAGGKLPK